jgi:hypothetical protein
MEKDEGIDGDPNSANTSLTAQRLPHRKFLGNKKQWPDGLN